MYTWLGGLVKCTSGHSGVSVEAETISLERPNAAGAVAALSTQQWLPRLPPSSAPSGGPASPRGPRAGPSGGAESAYRTLRSQAKHLKGCSESSPGWRKGGWVKMAVRKVIF